jgi:hypothetical protein
MVQTTINATHSLSTGGPTITVVSNVGFSTTGSFSISLSVGSTVPQVITYTGKGGTTTFTGCSTGTGTAHVGDFVTQSADDGYSNQIDGEYKIMPANGIQGNPSSSYGEYGFFTYSQSEVNGGSSTDDGYTVLLKTFTLPFVNSSGSLTSYYKMVGFYITGSTYEEFVSIGAPSASTFTNPNTGHSLINCYVSTFWQQ